MFFFSKISKIRLAGCHFLLRFLFNWVIKHRDCKVIEGHRSKQGQNSAFAAGYSKLKWPKGKHNKSPSWAVDVGPYPLKWPRKITAEQRSIIKEYARWYRFAGFVEGVAAVLGISVRWGGDWDGDGELTDQTFDDLPHFELSAEQAVNDDPGGRRT